MSKSSNVRAAARRCGQVISACCGDSLRTHQWTLPLKKVVKLKETFWAWMTQETPVTTDMYQEARRAVAFSFLLKQKPWCERSSGSPWKKNFWLASRKFQQTTQKGEWGWPRLCSVWEENCWPELGLLSDCEKTCEDFMNLIDTSSVEVCQVYGQVFPQVWRPDHIPYRGHWGSQEATQWQATGCGWESGLLNLKPLFSPWKWYIAPFRVGGKFLPQAEEFN